MIDEARTSGVKVYFASLMDICHLKNAELEAKHQKYKGRIVLRGDIVKDDSGSCAVFTEQGSSASQMAAAIVMDIISRLPGCDGQAADAESAYTQVKMKDAHKLLKFQNRSVQTFGFVNHESKAKAKPRRPSTSCSSSRTLLILERTWIVIEPGAQFDQAYPVAKRINTLLRHGELPREEDGAIEFWRLKDDLQNKFDYSQYWSDDVWKSKMAGGGGNKKRFQYCTHPSGQEILCLRALQGHSGRNPIDPTLQDNVIIPDNFFEYIYHVGCAVIYTPSQIQD